MKMVRRRSGGLRNWLTISRNRIGSATVGDVSIVTTPTPWRANRIAPPPAAVDLDARVGRSGLALAPRFPHWGKGKLVVLLHRQGLRLSTSMVGHI